MIVFYPLTDQFSRVVDFLLDWRKHNPHDKEPDMNMNFGSSITINGQRIVGNAQNIEIKNGKVIIDGKEMDTNGFKEKVLNIVVEGNVSSVKTESGDVTVNGTSGAIATASGDVTVRGNVSGSVSTMSGDVSVKGGVGANVSTMSGDIRH